MDIKALPILGSYEIEYNNFSDSRGNFKRLFCMNKLKEKISNKDIVQANLSETFQKGTIRGMHYQGFPKSEIKLIHCVHGSVFDVMVDLRESSKTFLQWHAIELSSSKNNMVIIPEGCAHGFQCLSNDAKLIYFHTEFYDPDYESGISYNDPLINITWPLDVEYISKRDMNHKFLKNNFKGLKV
tara:strand:- start:1578 stop:2129 length:552 start_codon:yes stop_codon:yes gene_type:complete